MYDGLLPNTAAGATTRVDRALPPEALKSKRLLDLSALEAGDLLLFRPVDFESDWISKAIVTAQEAGGFQRVHAQWTHAAVYLGDGEHICESNFWIGGFPNGVIMRSAHVYCDLKHAVRARRPKDMNPQHRLRIAIGALRDLKKRYSFVDICRFATVAWSGKGFWDAMPRGPRIKVRGLVCSTLYQDAFNFASNSSSIRSRAWCTPAHLSVSQDFEAKEPPLQWLEFE